FWLGSWDLTWPAEQSGGADGAIAQGTNQIEQILGGCAVEETFATADRSFLGRSLSVFDTTARLWRQTWVDNAGGYLLFTGGVDGSNFVLRTEPAERNGVTVVNRMVFADIRRNSLSWHWQASTDGGESWEELWTISYRRQNVSDG
ncbi:MAG: DUF1579 family protein, partial [Actinobacteria bacterium]|nr:DUF1579 family protein [Actinomycetota bacterium]